ncbi:hypothetical protein RIF29_31853 [Crotalaria pallida]|uniref:Nucleolar GTP-binding protein 2 N-terminal domain-containing protein n=1 Tax=Crotalaria pallida TaxID=3830 RepID=A0AAN9HXT7_CROPI
MTEKGVNESGEAERINPLWEFCRLPPEHHRPRVRMANPRGWTESDLASTRIRTVGTWSRSTRTRVVNVNPRERERKLEPSRVEPKSHLKDKKLLRHPHRKQTRIRLLDTEPFSAVFGPKAKRKRPNLLPLHCDSLSKNAEASLQNHAPPSVSSEANEGEGIRDLLFDKGQAKRTCGIVVSSTESNSSDVVQGGESDLVTAAKIVLHDWPRGRIPFFIPLPCQDNCNESE